MVNSRKPRRTSVVPHILERARAIQDRSRYRCPRDDTNGHERERHPDAQTHVLDGAHARERLDDDRDHRAVRKSVSAASVSSSHGGLKRIER